MPSLTLSIQPTGQPPADPFIADDGWKPGAECVDALCDHEVVRVDGGILDADEDLVWARGVGLGNVDALKTVDRVAKSCELNSTHWFLPLNQGGRNSIPISRSQAAAAGVLAQTPWIALAPVGTSGQAA